MKRLVTSLLCGATVAAFSIAPAMASPPNIGGTWKVEQTGVNGSTSATITITQSGSGIIGNNPNGTGYSGEFVSDTKINGKWHGPGGAGWLTIFVTPNGHSFNGSWGYNGRASNGTFIGNKFLPPSPLSAAGTWNVTGAGGQNAFVGRMACKQSGRGVVCLSNGVTLNGKVTPSDPRKVRATFNMGGASGVFSFWFNGDNNSFNGVWWRNATGTGDPTGRVVGQRSLSG
ncbi:MAG TPA: hypothetical protein VGI19_02265 [Candidatus Cybelea sp.]|jgi:hypothetical protein